MVSESTPNFPAGDPTAGETPVLSIVVPCFNEELNLLPLYERLERVLDMGGSAWELILVDDHSRDGTFEIATAISARDRRVKTIRLARNVGSHVALMCGLDHAKGDAVAMLAADMQDPPEIIDELMARWKEGYQVIWAVRLARKGVSVSADLSSLIFYRLMTAIIGRKELAGRGADMFLIDRIVVDALKRCRESNLSLFSLLLWLGFRQCSVSYVKEERLHGKSGWTFRKKLKLFVDSVVAFSYAPIRIMSLIGASVAFIGFLYALILITNRVVFGTVLEGWTSLMVVLLIIGGIQMTMMGVLGEYLWRTLDETRRRPNYNIERSAGWVEKRPAAHSFKEISPGAEAVAAQAKSESGGVPLF
jgi:polyisoprenyl-phosphate glycosyltransferase